MIKQLNGQISESSAKSPPPSANIPTGRSSPRCSKAACSPPPSCSRRSATVAPATPRATHSPATPAKPQWRSSRASAKPPASAGGATSGCATPSTPWPQQPTPQPLGARPLRPSPRPRPRPPPRATHPRAGLVPHRVALLARRRPVRPRPPPRAPATHHCHHSHPIGPCARPSRHPADGRRRCHPKGGPQGRARSA